MPIPDALEILMEEHEEGLRHLDALEAVVAEIGASGITPERRARLGEATTFLDTEIRHHNQREEEVLFPELEKVLPPFGPTAVMREEHRKLWDGLDRLEALLRDLDAGTATPATLADLQRVAVSIVHLLRQHIAKENDILFPMSRNVLTPGQLADISLRFAAIMAA